ncbi:MAG: isoprenylcysteine carboxylmethyltransferase family protein [Bacteroidetes bacterium]|nr:isoprenylcysteine carboxylmethyltransferase family protein [Bacteroidota bacterium]MDA0903628.1 isoprenylcysteine carboxylmethyltransferase family protein [Bacteroidota bacterium]MDA1242618.1 isoprenylcysteine carboxylmethyltransferase family protein [Bacteroidota bacterium]
MLIHELPRRGNSLFRWRSFIPLILVPPAMWMAWDAPFWADSWEWQATCWGLGFLGVAIRAKTIGHVPPGTSGRNTSEGQVAETLNTRGMYSLVRHPLYLGNFFMWMALVMATGRMGFALVVALLYMMYYVRIAMAEEAFLAGKFGQKYRDWAATVPAFVPKFWGRPQSRWSSAGNAFSLRHVIKREYNGVFALVFGFFFLDAARTAGMGIPSCAEMPWQLGLAVSVTSFAVLRFVKKRTRLLHVEGREFGR